MHHKRLIKNDGHSKKHKRLHLFANGLCAVCGKKVIRVKTLKKYRRIVKVNWNSVTWIIPCDIKVNAKISTVGHIIPRWKEGGTHDWANLQLECAACNNRAAAKDHEQFRKRPINTNVCQKCGGFNPRTQKRFCVTCMVYPFDLPIPYTIEHYPTVGIWWS